MYCTISETNGEVGSVKSITPPPPQLLLTDSSKAVVLLWLAMLLIQ